MKKLISVCIFIVALTGCQTNTFDQAQPRDSEAKAFFPEILQGKYIHISGDQKMELGDRHITLSSQTVGDSLTVKSGTPDTIFSISDTCVLKEFKGYYFLSRKKGDSWFVFSMKTEKNMLIIGGIKDSSDIARLKKISPHTCDSTGCVFRPTQKQFLKYIKGDGFKDRDTFIRVWGVEAL